MKDFLKKHLVDGLLIFVFVVGLYFMIGSIDQPATSEYRIQPMIDTITSTPLPPPKVEAQSKPKIVKGTALVVTPAKTPIPVGEIQNQEKELEMDISKVFEAGVQFVDSNLILVGLVIAITAWLKQSGKFKGEHLTLAAFGLSLLFVVLGVIASLPENANLSVQQLVQMLLNSLFVGFSSTGIYKAKQSSEGRLTITPPAK